MSHQKEKFHPAILANPTDRIVSIVSEILTLHQWKENSKRKALCLHQVQWRMNRIRRSKENQQASMRKPSLGLKWTKMRLKVQVSKRPRCFQAKVRLTSTTSLTCRSETGARFVSVGEDFLRGILPAGVLTNSKFPPYRWITVSWAIRPQEVQICL